MLKVSIHWDYENVPKKEIAKDLLVFANKQGDLETSTIYTNLELRSQLKKDFEELGYNCISVNLRGKKNIADFKLSVEVAGDRSDVIIIVSGDYYCQILLNKLQEQEKKGIIFARKGSECQMLKGLTDGFHFIEDLPELVKKNKQKTTNLRSQIAWDNAVNCLIETIKLASQQGKSTALPSIGKLIRQSGCFPKSKKVVVCKSDGSKFAKLSEFVDAVANDGKVIWQGDRLLLPSK